MPAIDKHFPDSPEANSLGCTCAVTGNGGYGKRGDGMLADGVRSWTVNAACKMHSNPRWWFSRRSTPPQAPVMNEK